MGAEWSGEGRCCLVPAAGSANPLIRATIRVDDTFASRLREAACPTTSAINIDYPAGARNPAGNVIGAERRHTARHGRMDI